MVTLRRPVVASICSTCGRELHERIRKPCPTCKGMSRTFSVTANDKVDVTDRAN